MKARGISKYAVKGSSRPRWRYRISIGIDANGKRLYASGAGFLSEKEVREAVAKRREELKHTSVVPPLRVFVHPPAVIGGQPATLTLKFSEPITTSDFQVTLASSVPSIVLPEFVSVPPGGDAASVEVETRVVDEDSTIFLTAVAGSVSSSVALNLTPAPSVESEHTLRSWVQHWLDRYAPDRCQPKTLERYRQLAAYLNGTPMGDTRLSDLTHTAIEDGLYALLREPAKRHEHLSARSVRHIAGLLSVALNKAFRLDLLSVNPVLRVELPAVQKKDARSLTPDEIRALRKTCFGNWTFALVELAFAVGARRGELLALTWQDVDWASHTITISKSLEQTRAGLRIKAPKGEKTRSCQIPKSAIVALQFLRDQQAEHRRLFAADYQDQGLIFCEPDGSYHKPDLISQTVIRRLRKAGIDNASFHTLRHTHASNLLSRGVPLPAVSARLGHTDTNVTARIYSHALPADDQRAADAWDEVVDGRVQ
jgi:integrase